MPNASHGFTTRRSMSIARRCRICRRFLNGGFFVLIGRPFKYFTQRSLRFSFFFFFWTENRWKTKNLKTAENWTRLNYLLYEPKRSAVLNAQSQTYRFVRRACGSKREYKRVLRSEGRNISKRAGYLHQARTAWPFKLCDIYRPRVTFMTWPMRRIYSFHDWNDPKNRVRISLLNDRF